MKPKIIIDTNYVNSDTLDGGFFGNRKELLKLSHETELVFPEIVIDELKNHRRKIYEAQQQRLQTNTLHRATLAMNNLPADAATNISYDKLIEWLLEQENIPYTTVKIKDPEKAFYKIYQLAANHLPPFEENGDKGFKDAVIVCTIEQILEEDHGARLALITNDHRLTEFFKGDDRVPVFNTSDAAITWATQPSTPAPCPYVLEDLFHPITFPPEFTKQTQSLISQTQRLNELISRAVKQLDLSALQDRMSVFSKIDYSPFLSAIREAESCGKLLKNS